MKKKCYLVIDFGSTYTKLVLINKDTSFIEACESAITTIETSIEEGYHEALKRIENKIDDFEIVKTLGCSSAAGGLKIAVIGNVKELTVAAAKKAALGAGAKITNSFSFTLNDEEIEELESNNVDMILLSGGTDGGNTKHLLENCKKLASSKVSVPIVFAGNKSCLDEAKKIFSKTNINVYFTKNIMPVLNKVEVDAVRTTIREVFMKHIIYAKGIDSIQDILENEIIPTPLAVLNAANLLSLGTSKEDGLGDLIVVDIGGATTDVHSICNGSPTRGDVSLKGIEEPHCKRTVEGDLGMKYSSQSLLEAVGEKMFKKISSRELDDNEIQSKISYRKNNIKAIPATKEEIEFDTLMAKICTKVSLTRHAGEIFTTPTPFGEAYYQIGKDLTRVKTVIGTGGVLVHSDTPREILEYSNYSLEEPTVLKPNKPNYYIDKDYIMSTIGVLSEVDENLAFKLLKKHIREV